MTNNAPRARGWALSAIAVTVGLAVTIASGGHALAAGPGKLKGQILVSDEPIPALEDENTMVAVLKKWSKTTLEKPKDADGWSFRLMSFPDKKPGTTTLSLLFYDVSDGKKRYLTSKDITCDPSATILASEVEVTVEDGVKPGMKIELALSRIVGDKQTDLAKAKLSFK